MNRISAVTDREDISYVDGVVKSEEVESAFFTLLSALPCNCKNRY